MKIINIKIKTKTKEYFVVVGSNIIKNITTVLSDKKITFQKCLIVIDKNIPRKFQSTLIKKLSLKKLLVYKFNANEKNKNDTNVNKIHTILLENRFNRRLCNFFRGWYCRCCRFCLKYL